MPELEKHILADINNFMRFPGVGPFESYDAEHTVEGGEKLELAGFDIDVYFTPGHSPGHVSYSIREHSALFSGDVLFQGSIGRTDLPGGDTQTLLDSIAMLMEKLPPGHRRLPRPHGRHDARDRSRRRTRSSPSRSRA